MHRLEGREYKLLLDPRHFTERPSEEIASAFFDGKLRPIISDWLGPRKSGAPRYEKRFDTMEKRIVDYWDTRSCHLTNADYTLRERAAEDGSDRDFTLKLRMPDYFVVAATSLPGSDQRAKTTFEEDIAPLEVAHAGPVSGVAISTPRSMRSRFALSTSQPVKSARDVKKLAQVFLLFPSLTTNLKAAGIGGLARAGPLHRGPRIREYVFKGAKVRFSNRLAGEFALTLWYFERSGWAASVAEISFQCGIRNERMPGGSARRTFDLFIGLQEDLGDWVNLRDASKTELALPARCRVAR